MIIVEKNEGARRANDKMHQQRLEQQNNSVEKKLDKLIELAEKMLEKLEGIRPK